jgi:hypothetical protein
MESFDHFLSQHISWLWITIACCLAALAVLAAITVPAYFIVYPIAANVRRGIASYLSALFARHEAASENRRLSMETLIEDFKHDSGISCTSERNTRIEGALASFSQVDKSLRRRLDEFLDVPRALERTGNRVIDAAATTAPTFPNTPSPKELSAEHGNLRTARTRLIVSSVILIALVSVNTGMLGQILRDLGFIPHDLVYFGIPLFLVFAFILTLAEAGLGYVHTASRPAPDEPGRVAVWPAVAVCLAGVIACVEGFFYSQVAPSRDSLVDLPIGYHVKQGSLFFLWGATLVLVLFGLGTIWSTSLERISRSADHFPQLVQRLERYRERFAAACALTEKSADHLRQQVDIVCEKLRAAAQDSNSITASAAQLKEATSSDQLDAMPRLLTTTETYHFMHLSGLWFCLAIVTFSILSAAGFYAFGYVLLYYFGTAATVFASLGLAACFVALGLLFPRGVLLVDGSGTRRLIVSGSLWRGRTAAGMIISVILGFTAVIWRIRPGGYQIALWILILLLGASLAAAASQAAATGKGLHLWFYRCNNILLAGTGAAVRLCGRGLLAAVYIVEIIALAFAAPVFLLRGRGLPPLLLTADTERQTLKARSAS